VAVPHMGKSSAKKKGVNGRAIWAKDNP
jgi:hypothetical protein